MTTENMLSILGTLIAIGVGAMTWYLRRLTMRIDQLTEAFYGFQLAQERRLTKVEGRINALEKTPQM